VRDIDLTYLRAGIGMVTQDTYLFIGSIEKNLRCAKEGRTMVAEAPAAPPTSTTSLRPARRYKRGWATGLKLSGGEAAHVHCRRGF
jgi:ABC-type transport system involved in Fe-S cluster assembly fused permease/ATPase subunit